MKSSLWFPLFGLGGLLNLLACGSGLSLDGTGIDADGAGGAAGAEVSGAAGAEAGGGGMAGTNVTGTGGNGGQGGSAGASFGGASGKGLGGSAAAGSGGIGPAGSGGGSGGPTNALQMECQACLQAHCDVCAGGSGGCNPCSGVDCSQGSPLEVCACDTHCQTQCASWDVCSKAGQGGGGGMGDSGAGGGMGGGAVAGSGGQGGGLQEDCYNGKGDLSSDVVDCASPACEDTCASLCVAPHPLFDNVTFAGSTKGHQNFFDPVCSSNQSTGPDVAFVYQTQSGGELTVMLDSGLDMVLSLRQTCGGGGADVRCSDAVAGGTEQASVVVEPGETWYVVVGGAVPGVEGPFSLTAHVTPAGCGNGKVDLGESCDDGNKDNTDACNTDCQFTACKATGLTDATAMEGFPVVSMKGQTSAGGASTIQPSCARLGSSAPDKVFSLRANSTGFLEVKVTPENGQDLVLSVLDSCFTTALELSCSDGAPAGGVERLSVPVLKGQTLYIAVDGFDTDQAGDFTLEARSIPQNCGDGWVASSEQCDGGQEGAKDPNCSFHCTRKLLGDSAPEGPSAVPLTAGQPVEGEIFPAGDEDLFSLTVAPGQTGLVLEMGEIDGHGCAELALDSELTLLDANGNEVASNDDAAGLGFCSRLELNDLLPGGYTVRVRSSRLFAPQQVFSYRLTATSP